MILDLPRAFRLPFSYRPQPADTSMMTAPHRFEDIKTAHPRAYEPWHPVDELIVRAMMGAAADVAQMAERLGRTEAEIVAYLEGNGVGLNGEPSG
jgi:hypothetical protein